MLLAHSDPTNITKPASSIGLEVNKYIGTILKLYDCYRQLKVIMKIIVILGLQIESYES